jgi:hypothetical protein
VVPGAATRQQRERDDHAADDPDRHRAGEDDQADAHDQLRAGHEQREGKLGVVDHKSKFESAAKLPAFTPG